MEANDITLDEGRMKTIATMFDAGKTPEQIAKKMKLPVATVKSILGEEDLPEEMLWEFTDQQITQLKKEYSGLKGAKISLARANQLRNIFDKISNTQLPKLYKADIPFLSTMALTRMIKKVFKYLKVLSYQRLNKCLGNKLLKHILVTNHLKIFRKIRTRTLRQKQT